VTEALNKHTVLDATVSRESRRIILDEASNELVFAVVGHAGSGTSVVAQQLKNLLKEITVEGNLYDVEILKARKVIEDWARSQSLQLPEATDQPSLTQVKIFQDYGDLMRCEKTDSGNEDYSAIARVLVLQIRDIRAKKTNVKVAKGQPVKPDRKPRAYILDSIRHPAEVQLLRHVYKNAFVFIGVVCEEERRITRIGKKYCDAGRTNALDFMKRDADAAEKHGQHVADAFHLSDYFVDNTVDRMKGEKANPDWDVVENLSRLVKILNHSELVRPTVAEMAMHHAHSAQMQSGCLSRQVGAAVVDIHGNMIATGTNEVPKAGGGRLWRIFRARIT